jgi:transcriptional/translational regulatory protein YebC/TACO1
MTHGDEDETVCCEGFGPAGSVLLVVCRARHVPSALVLREVLRQYGGDSGATNSVAYLFHPVGVLRYAASGPLPARALEAGAEAVRTLSSGEWEVLTDPGELATVQAALLRKGHVARAAVCTRRAARTVVLDAGQVEALRGLVQALRAVEGVEQVYTNAEIPE